MKCCAGYREVDTGCEPICSPTCIHGQCISPNKCKCDPGYVQHNSTIEETKCLPFCENECPNAVCTAPNECTCNEGYELSEDKATCKAICKQDCESLNAHCSEPDKCVCDRGYEWNENYDSSTLSEDSKCVPICQVPCSNGKCTAPNVCTCDNGYESNMENPFDCEAKCEPICRFGNCTAPNVCTCDQGYRLNERNVCEPICSRSCVMGSCIAPETCGCFDGYGLINESRYVCEPICEKSCVNAICTAPGVCTCDQGYSFNGTEEENWICKPFCKVPCYPYGDCIAPDICNCFEGYQMISMDTMDNTTDEPSSACQPICNETCVNGRCVEPNVCKCDSGYRLLSNETSICEPICETPCISNSSCTKPNTCTCNTGYESANNGVENICEPICENDCGANSSCAEPNVCSCDEGFEKSSGNHCKPVCSSCQNGTCVGPEKCHCSEGFSLIDDAICMPFCENGCDNGVCVAPNVCQCHDGFRFNGNKSECVKSCSRDCKGHGVCLDDERPCDCSYGWTGWDCNRPVVCILLLDRDYAKLQGMVIRNETNSTMFDARIHAPYCYQCNETVGNKTHCFLTNSDDESTKIVCLVETGSPCHQKYHGNSANVSTMAGAIASITILLIAIGSGTVYFMIRRHQKMKMQAVIQQSALIRGSIATESLLSEEDNLCE